jgi:hypothetical protein
VRIGLPQLVLMSSMPIAAQLNSRQAQKRLPMTQPMTQLRHFLAARIRRWNP